MYLNLYDLVKLTLVNSPEEVRQLLKYELGFFEVDLLKDENAVDIKVNFVDHIKMQESTCFIADKAAYDDESFYITNLSKRIFFVIRNFEPKFEINCEVGIKPEELYFLLCHFFINHALISKRATFVHSSALFWGNKGLLFPAWIGTGKTTTLLSFLKQGGQFISNDLTIVKEDGTMLSYPESLLLSKQHIREVPSSVKLERRLTLNPHYILGNALKIVLVTSGRVLQMIPIHSVKEAALRGYSFGKKLGGAPTVSIPFHSLFPQGKIKNVSNIDIIFFMERYMGSKIKISEINGTFVADRMLPSFLVHIPELYEDFRFAFPERGEELIKEREEQYKDIVHKAFTGKQAYHVKLPTGYDSQQLFEQLSSLAR